MKKSLKDDQMISINISFNSINFWLFHIIFIIYKNYTLKGYGIFHIFVSSNLTAFVSELKIIFGYVYPKGSYFIKLKIFSN